MAQNTANNIDENLNKLNRSIDELVRLLKEEHKGSYKGRNFRYNPNYESDYATDGRKSWKKHYKKLVQTKKWVDMSEEERNDFIEEGRRRKRAAKREDASNELYKSGLSRTGFGRYAETIMSRHETIDNLRAYSKYLKSGGAKTTATALFGNGKIGAIATKGLGTFGKALGVVSKAMRHPLVDAIFLVIDGLKALTVAMDDYKAYTTEMYKFQNKQEELQFNRSKQQYTIENQMKIENISAQGDIQMKMLETQGATMLDALKLTSAQYAKSVDIALGPLTKGINETAYEAANASIDAAVEKQKLDLHKEQRETQYGRYVEQRELQQVGKLAGLEAQKNVVSAEYEANMKRTALEQEIADANHTKIWNWFRNADNNVLQSNGKTTTEDNKAGVSGTINPWENKRYDVINDWESAGLERKHNFTKGGQIAENFGIGLGRAGNKEKYKAELEYQTDVLKRSADYQKTVIDYEYQVAQAQKDSAINIANKQLDLAVESKEIVIDTAAQVEKTWLQLAQKTEKWLENFDSITNDLGINLGYTTKHQLHDYQTSMFSVVENVAAKFGKSIEEVSEMQRSFVENTGRNRLMDEGNYYDLQSLSKYLGNDDSLAANYASEMEIFNADVSDSVDMIGEVLEDVNKIGLNGRKYTKTLVDNLKLAQKYQFKEGTKGLMNMAKWAENTRFNLASLSGMLDKVRNGGLEGVITQAAQFQVLGGHAAMNADPIAMMYEAYADPEAYGKRMQDMTKGYGEIDKKTGETKFGGDEIMMMEQIAKVQGRSLEEVQNEVRARNKREVVAKQLNGNFDEDQQSFISNNATYNKETGQFQVKVKGADGKYYNKDVNQLTETDIEQIMPEDYQGKMLKGMEDIVSALESMKGTEIAQNANVAAATYEQMLNEYNERAKIANESFAKHRDEYIEQTKKGMDAATASFNNFIGIFDDGNSAVKNSVTEIESTAQNINLALNDTADIIARANGKIASASGIKYETPKFSEIYDNKDSYKAPWQQVNDGIVSGNNSPIVSAVPNVTKINDGLVESDPKDVAIFAKEGGVIGNFLNDLYNDVHSANSGTISLDTVNVTISGSLDLSSGGQSVNIINELQTNPMLLRSLSRMLAQQISSAMNGGRGTSSIGIGSV